MPLLKQFAAAAALTGVTLAGMAADSVDTSPVKDMQFMAAQGLYAQECKDVSVKRGVERCTYYFNHAIAEMTHKAQKEIPLGAKSEQVGSDNKPLTFKPELKEEWLRRGFYLSKSTLKTDEFTQLGQESIATTMKLLNAFNPKKAPLYQEHADFLQQKLQEFSIRAYHKII